MTGFLAPLASTMRLCQYRIGENQDILSEMCGEQMIVVLDERPKVEGPLTELATDGDKRLRIVSACRVALVQASEGKMSATEIVRSMGIALRGISKKV
jgi:hypothetical protein